MIHQALHRVDGELRLEQVKTEASVSVLPIPAPLVSILRGHPSRQLEARFTAGAQWRDTGLIFTTASGGYLEPRNIDRMFHSLCALANVPQLRVHDLRHSGATLLFTMGVPPATVQRILRHSSINVTTGTYVEVIEAVQRDALNSMGPLFEQIGDTSSGRLSPMRPRLSSRLSSKARESGPKSTVDQGGANGTRTRDFTCGHAVSPTQSYAQRRWSTRKYLGICRSRWSHQHPNRWDNGSTCCLPQLAAIETRTRSPERSETMPHTSTVRHVRRGGEARVANRM
jgi:hypothetical protein